MMLQESMSQLPKSLLECGGEKFREMNRSAILWKIFPASELYCFENPNAKNPSTILHEASISRPCVLCLCIVPATRHLWYCKSKNVKQTKAIRIYIREKYEGAKTRVKTETEKIAIGSWSMEKKYWDFFCYPIGIPFCDNVVWFHAIQACSCFSRLFHCILHTLEFKAFERVHNFVSLFEHLYTIAIRAGGTKKVRQIYAKWSATSIQFDTCTYGERVLRSRVAYRLFTKRNWGTA